LPSQTPNPAAHAPRSFGSWRVEEKLGEGGMCVVWRATRDGRDYAVKVLSDTNPTSTLRFVEEGEMLQRIHHPNVVRVHHVERHASPPWLVMELLAGRDLEDERAQGPVEPERAARLIADVASGLAAVHALGLRHRDVKPSNIVLGMDGVPRLIDFGIARDLAQAHKTQEGFLVGTAAYLPPEVFDEAPRAAQAAETADVYALGQTLCELLTGEPVFPRDGAQGALLARIVREKIDRPHLDPRDWRKATPPALAQIVRAATHREPEARTPSANALERALRDWLDARSRAGDAPMTHSFAEITSPQAAPQLAPRRSGWLGFGVAAAAVALAAVVLGVASVGVAAMLYLDTSPDPAAVAAIREAIAQQSPQVLSSCPRGTGRVTLDVEVDGAGAVTVTTVASTTGNSKVDTCEASGIRKVKFPVTARDASVRVPLTVK
jgi:serine/threonine-protein kinase